MKTFIATVLIVSLHTTLVQAKSVTPLVVVGQSEKMSVINEVSLTGTVTSPRTADLSVEVSGLVEAVLFDEGQKIRQGDVLLKLDQEMEKLALDAAQTKTRQARFELAEAKRLFTDAKRLAKHKTISKNDVQSLQAEVSINGAELQRARVEEQQQEAVLRRHNVLAPFAGIISHKHAEAGEWLSPGDAIAQLIAIEHLRIDFQVPQSIFPRTTQETSIRVSLDAMTDKIFDGKIITIVPITDARARTFMIRVTIDADKRHITPGMSANGLLQLDTGRKAVVISRDAVLRHPDGRTTVWIVNQDKTVAERSVKIGLGFSDKVVIEEGLDTNVPVVLQGNESLREGQMISIKQD